MPYNVFRMLSLRMTTTAVELVIFRRFGAKLLVLLTKRPSDDPDWPDMWHYPGSIIRPDDKSLDEVLERLQQHEIINKFAFWPKFVKVNVSQTMRGTVVQLIHFGEIIGIPQKGKYFSVKKLPSGFIKSQTKGLLLAYNAFTHSKKL